MSDIVEKKNTLYTNELIILLFFSFCCRLLYSIYGGVDNIGLGDWSRYNEQSNNILEGNLNLNVHIFIVAPLFPYILAFFKYIFSDNHVFFLSNFQIILSSISVVYLSKSCFILFKSKKKSLLCGYLFAVFPMTIYYTHLLGQESIFQSLFIFSCYYYIKYFKTQGSKELVLFGCFFSLALLTKSHIMLIVPFFIIGLFLRFKILKKTFLDLIIFLSIIFFITLPYGLYNLSKNDVYVISSTGYGGFFALGHNEDVYTYIAKPPILGTYEHTELQSMRGIRILHRMEPNLPKLKDLNHSQLQREFFKMGLNWILKNPINFIELTYLNIKNFIMPGVNKDHHTFQRWLFAFLISLPIFLSAYYEIIKMLIKDFRSHLVVVSVFLGMIGMSILYYTQVRFRVITLEPLYIIYASSFMIELYQRFLNSFKREK